MRILSLIAVALLVSSLAAPARAGMAEDCEQNRDPDLVISGCTAVIGSGQWQGKELAYAYNNRGLAYYNLGNYSRAIQNFDQVLRLEVEGADVYIQRGLAYLELGDIRRAIQDFDQALRLDPGNAGAYAGRGLAYSDLGDHRRAIQGFDQALRLDPDYELAKQERAIALDHLSRDREAEPQPGSKAGTKGPDLDRDKILAAQRMLAQLDLYDGAIDGIVGPKTRRAVRQFQESWGYQVTGEIDQRLLGQLDVAANIATEIAEKEQGSGSGATANVGVAEQREKTFSIEVYGGGTRALYTGGIYHGSVEALLEVMDAHPNVRLLGLNSSGGNISVGENLFFLIRERGLSTFAWKKCASACTLAFMGGQARLLGVGSAIGFHAGGGGGHGIHFSVGPSFASRARVLAEITGIDFGFIDHAYSTDASGLFVPPPETLIETGFVTGQLTGFLSDGPIEASYVFVADPFEFATQALKEQRWEDAASNLEAAIGTGTVFPHAHFMLGYLYAHGLGVPKDLLRAAELYRVASDAGYPQASHNLGLMLLHGEGVEEDHENGLQLVQRAADAGDVYAKFNLARWYTDGRYGERNLFEAFLLLTDCANGGHWECQVELANRYSNGDGAALDLQKARELYSEALSRMPETDAMMEATRARIEWIDGQLGR